MLHARDFFAVLAFIGARDLMLHHLLFGEGMVSFGQSCEVLIAHRTGQAPLIRKLTLPLAMSLLIVAPIVLPL